MAHTNNENAHGTSRIEHHNVEVGSVVRYNRPRARRRYVVAAIDRFSVLHLVALSGGYRGSGGTVHDYANVVLDADQTVAFKGKRATRLRLDAARALEMYHVSTPARYIAGTQAEPVLRAWERGERPALRHGIVVSDPADGFKRADTANKIGVRSITIDWSESAQLDCPIRCANFAHADIHLRRAARHAPAGDPGPYHKTGFTIVWDDGETYQGRIDLNRTRHATRGEILRAHVRAFCLHSSGRKRPAHMSEQSYRAYLQAAGGDAMMASFGEVLDRYDVGHEGE